MWIHRLLSALFIGSCSGALAAPAAPAAPWPQWGVLRRLAKGADEVGSAGRRAGRRVDGVANRASRALEVPPSRPGTESVVISGAGGELRGYSAEWPSGRTFESPGEALARFTKEGEGFDYDVIIDPLESGIDLLLEFADAGVDVSVLGDRGQKLDVKELTMDTGSAHCIELREGLLMRLESSENYGRTLDEISESFALEDVLIASFFDPIADREIAEKLARAGGAKEFVDVFADGGAERLFKRRKRTPILAVGRLRDGALRAPEGTAISPVPVAQLVELADQHRCPLVVLGIDGNPPSAGRLSYQDRIFVSGFESAVRADGMRGFLAGLGTRIAPVMLESLSGLDEKRATLAAKSVRITGAAATSAGLEVTCHGLGERGMTGLPPWWLLLGVCLFLAYIPSQSIGELFAWPLRFDPVSMRGLKHAFLGLLPFVPFGPEGAAYALIIGVALLLMRVVGCGVARVAGFDPDAHRGAKLSLLGFAATAGIALVLAGVGALMRLA